MTNQEDDWESADFSVQLNTIVKEEEELKLKNQKLVEDSDLALSEDLFGKTSITPCNNKNPVKKQEKQENQKKEEKEEKENKKQEKILKKKNAKKEKERAAEIYGEAEEDEYYLKYCEYEDSILG